MIASCQQKYQFYEEFITGNGIEIDQVPWKLIDNGTFFTRNKLKGNSEVLDLVGRIGYLEQIIR